MGRRARKAGSIQPDNALPTRLREALVADGHPPDQIGAPDYLRGLSVRALLATPGIGPVGVARIQALLAPHGAALEP